MPLAYALPYEKTNIIVFLDHIRNTVEPKLAPILLAHVLVHEITHMLEGTARHSATGIMKANWTPADYQEMSHRPLPFAAEDVLLVRIGLARREIPTMVAVTAAQTTN